MLSSPQRVSRSRSLPKLQWFLRTRCRRATRWQQHFTCPHVVRWVRVTSHINLYFILCAIYFPLFLLKTKKEGWYHWTISDTSPQIVPSRVRIPTALIIYTWKTRENFARENTKTARDSSGFRCIVIKTIRLGVSEPNVYFYLVFSGCKNQKSFEPQRF